MPSIRTAVWRYLNPRMSSHTSLTLGMQDRITNMDWFVRYVLNHEKISVLTCVRDFRTNCLLGGVSKSCDQKQNAGRNWRTKSMVRKNQRKFVIAHSI
jgi:hypothetical protein